MTTQNWIDIGLVVLIMIVMYHSYILGKRIDILKIRVDIHYKWLRKLLHDDNKEA